MERGVKNKDIHSNALYSLINQTPNDSTWYELNYSLRDTLVKKIEDTRLSRKINRIFCPDPFQFIYFYIPFLIVFFLLTSSNKKEEEFKRKRRFLKQDNLLF